MSYASGGQARQAGGVHAAAGCAPQILTVQAPMPHLSRLKTADHVLSIWPYAICCHPCKRTSWEQLRQGCRHILQAEALAHFIQALFAWIRSAKVANHGNPGALVQQKLDSA
jgi:hypothetical protein